MHTSMTSNNKVIIIRRRKTVNKKEKMEKDSIEKEMSAYPLV